MTYKVTRIEEGSWDFVKGASSEIGKRVRNSGVANGVRNVVQAGRDASTQGELTSAVAKFYALYRRYQASNNGARPPQDTPVSNRRTEPTDQSQQRPQSQQNQRSQYHSQQSNVTQPSSASGYTQYNPSQYTFSAYMQQVLGDRIDEGMVDFARGAGSAIGGKIASAVNRYGERPSVLRDIYAAGKKASDAGNAQRNQLAADGLAERTKRQGKIVIQLLAKLGPRANEALRTAVFQCAGKENAPALYRIIARNARAQGIRI